MTTQPPNIDLTPDIQETMGQLLMTIIRLQATVKQLAAELEGVKKGQSDHGDPAV